MRYLLIVLLFIGCSKKPDVAPIDFTSDQKNKSDTSHICAAVPLSQEGLKDSLDALPPASVDSTLGLGIQINFIHFDPSYLVNITDSKILKYQELLVSQFPDFLIVPNDQVNFFVHPEEFYMEDLERDESGNNEASVLEGKFTEGALNINFVPSMGETRGYTLPFFYKDNKGKLQDRGQVAWVDYEVFENPRGLDGWVSTSSHEIGHALGLGHALDSTGYPGIQHGYNDRIMGYAKMKDQWTLEEREQMYLFLAYEREAWHR